MSTIKPIKQFNGEYGVSDDGKVFTYKQGRNREVKQHITKGYRRVFLFKGNKRFAFPVHRLVAIEFLKPVKGKDWVNHKDGNRRNNNVSNLEWCTREENWKHAKEVLGNNAKGKNNPNYGYRKSKFYPNKELRNRLLELGIPYYKHDIVSLGEMLPLYLRKHTDDGISFSVETSGFQTYKNYSNTGWVCCYKEIHTSAATEADARAKMLIYLKEQNLI